jgi:hypothetical protein
VTNVYIRVLIRSTKLVDKQEIWKQRLCLLYQDNSGLQGFWSDFQPFDVVLLNVSSCPSLLDTCLLSLPPILAEFGTFGLLKYLERKMNKPG